MEHKILIFGVAKDILGSDYINVDLPDKELTMNELKLELLKQFPMLSDLPSFMIAVNDSYLDKKLRLKSSDEIALIPPTSGG